MIQEVATTPVSTPTKPPVSFEITDKAIAHNTNLLQQHNLDLAALLAAHPDSTFGPGSKSQPIPQLEKVLGGHPNFVMFCAILKNGMPYHMTTKLTEEHRIEEVEANLL